ncbi:hypothetical protein [Arthrobacter sp. NPDC090010]|uniref:hypothetical protein n=1 Tax=Arthrobacter sp. NPDC090010 TaxID=3363942 RepID=UPI0038150E27
MTPAFRPDEHDVVDELLQDLDAGDAEALRPALNGLRELSSAAPVEPSPELAALLGGSAGATVVDLDAARRTRPGRRRRAVVLAAVAAVAATAATAGVAAASQDGGIPRIVRIITGQPVEQPPVPTETHVSTPEPVQPSPSSPTSSPAPSPSFVPSPAPVPRTVKPVVPKVSSSKPSVPAQAKPKVPQLPLRPRNLPTLPHLLPAPLPAITVPGGLLLPPLG